MVSGRDDRPYFFLSYARTPKRDPADRDDPDRWVYKLYKDLCGVILQMTDARPEEAGFMDRENKIGAQWSPELTSALAQMPGLRAALLAAVLRKRQLRHGNGSPLPAGRSPAGPGAAGGRRHRARAVDPDRPGEAALRRAVGAVRPQVPGRALLHRGLLRDHEAAELPGRLPAGRAPARRADHRHRRRERRRSADEAAGPPHGRAPDFDSLPSAFGPASARRTADGAAADRGAGARHLDAARPAGPPTITATRRIPGARTGRTTPSRWPTTPRNWPRSAWTASRWSGPFDGRHRELGRATGARCRPACAWWTPG